MYTFLYHKYNPRILASTMLTDKYINNMVYNNLSHIFWSVLLICQSPAGFVVKVKSDVPPVSWHQLVFNCTLYD